VRHLALTATIIVLCCSLISCASRSGASAPEPVEEFPGLVKIKKIYIANLGNEEGAGLVREKLRLRLAKTARFSVVEVPEEADAILTGVAGVERSYYGSGGDLQTHYAGIGILRLVDGKTKDTIWTFEYKRSRGRPTSVSTKVADQTIDKLLKDTIYVDNKKTNMQPK
jgi:hypothetical protein